MKIKAKLKRLWRKIRHWIAPKYVRRRRAFMEEAEREGRDRHFAKLMETNRKMRKERGYKIPPLDELNEEQRKRLEEYKVKIFAHAQRLLQAEGGCNLKELDWKMAMFVQTMALQAVVAERGLVLLAGEIVQMRIRAILRMALRTKEGKAIEKRDAE